MPRSQCEKENVQLIQELAEVDGPFESPINLNFRDLIKLELPSLTWNKPDAIPKKMKITNTGHTVIISGKWKSERPYLTGGPLDGKYVFSQVHFHWGPDNCKGSEHQVCGESFPLEMHVAHFKTDYMTQEAALREKDGMVVLVYLFRLQEESNNSIKKIISALPCIRQANTSKPLECRSILALCNPFTDDYFTYWGSVVTSTCAHILLWIVCREPFGISREQMEEFRKICDVSCHPIRRNSRDPQPLHKRNVFHVNASRHMDEPMLPIKSILGCFCIPSSDTRDERSEGDGGCKCNDSGGPQEELEGSQDIGCRKDKSFSTGNGVYLQQTVYYQHATVRSVPALRKKINNPVEAESPDHSQEVSQSCCFLPPEEEKPSRQVTRERRRKTIDSVTTLVNLIETLETLKTQTYKKLKEIESINHEIKGMKSSCENLEERHWLRHAEKIMSRQKRFTIRSSQCCFSELKKLAKECNFDRILEDNIMNAPGEDKSLFPLPINSNACGDKIEVPGLQRVDSTPFSFYKSERFSRKTQKLIQSFFEDIKETEETQMNLERNLLLKKIEKLSKRTSERSDVSLMSLPPRHMFITKNMMNEGKIRDQFFTEVVADDKVLTPTETKMVPRGKKKSSFFRISLSGFETDKATRKGPKRPFFTTKSALAWLRNRLNSIHDPSPVIPLRITDIELKSGIIIKKKKSRHSVKSVRKVTSDEHIRTEISSYMSESFLSDSSDKVSRYSRHNMGKARSMVQADLENSETKKSEISLMRMVKDMNTHNFFVQLNSTNISSGTSTESEKREDCFISRSRESLWEGKDDLKRKSSRPPLTDLEKEVQYSTDKQVTGNVAKNENEEEMSSSSNSSIFIKENSNLMVVQSQLPPTKVVMSRDVCVDTTEDGTTISPKRKKLKVEWKCKSNYVEPDDSTTFSFIETECRKVSYVENECQADLINFMSPTPNESRKNSCEKIENFVDINFQQIDHIKTNTPEPIEASRGTSIDTSIFLTLPMCDEMKDMKNSMGKSLEVSETSSSPRKSIDSLSVRSKDFSFEIKRTVVLNNSQGACWPEEAAEKVTETPTDEKFQTEVPSEDNQSQEKPALENTGLPSIEERNKGLNVQVDATANESHSVNLFTVKEVSKSPPLSQYDLSEYNEDDLQTDSNGTMHYHEQKESRDTTPCTPSSEDEKRLDTSIATASSILMDNTQQKIFSVESFNSLRNSYDTKHRKRRQCIKKRSKQLLRKNNTMIRKLNKLSGSNIDFTNLTEEEQLKIISTNVARFVKQKLVEHKQFFDLEKDESVTLNGGDWKNPENEPRGELKTKEMKPEPQEKSQIVDNYKAEEQPPLRPTPPTSRLPPPQSRSPPPPSSPMAPLIPEIKEELEASLVKDPPLNVADNEKDDKIDPGRQTLDFIKLNKIMAGKYKRRCPPETGKRGVKTTLKKEVKEVKEPAKPPTPKPKEVEQPPKVEVLSVPKKELYVGQEIPKPTQRWIRPPSAGGVRRGGSLPRGHRSDIPVPQIGPARLGRLTHRSASASPDTSKIAVPRNRPTPPLALQNTKQPKKRMIPTYTVTSYLSAPNEVIQFQQRELDKYLHQGLDITDLFQESKDKSYKNKKNRDTLSKKNLDYLIMLQKRINHEITANIENSMNYVKTLLSQDYNGTAIIEKAPVKNSLDVFEPGSGIVLIGMNDQPDYSSSGSDFSEESGFYCIYQGSKRRDRRKREIIIKRNESGDSGLVDSRIFEELENDTDSSCNREISIFVHPKSQDEEHHDSGDVSDVLKKYIYHLGDGEEADFPGKDVESLRLDDKKPLKKRKERILDMPQEMKLKILDMLEEETKPLETEVCAVEVDTSGDEPDIDIIAKISEMVKEYLDEYEKKQQQKDREGGYGNEDLSGGP